MNFSNIKTHVIYILIILVLCVSLFTAINSCSNVSGEYKNNIEALNDTIKYYKTSNGNLVATKRAFESDVKTLKLLNENLYNEIEELKLKGKVSSIVYVNGTIENELKDTAYIIQRDTIYKGFSKDFNFNNDFRILEGNVKYNNDSLGVKITKDIMNFDYTVAIDKNNEIYIKSTNPYVKYKELSGFRLSTKKQKHWHFGPSITYGYDFINKNHGLTVGGSVMYSLISW